MRIRKLHAAALATLGALAGALVVSSPALASPPEKPVAKAATAVGANGATLHGELNPGASSEKLHYEFVYRQGATCSEGTFAPEPPGEEAEGNHREVSLVLTGLQPGVVYSFCLNVTNGEEESTISAPMSFKTPSSKPAVDGESESGVTPFDAMLEGLVNPESQATSYHFEYASNSALTGATSVGSGTLPGVFEDQAVGPVDLGGTLEPSSTYYYRVVAVNGTGTTNGPIQSFTTPPLEAPVIDGESASAITQNDALLHALINPNYQATTYQFKLGSDTSYSLATVPATPGELGASFGDSEVVVDLLAEGVELEPNTEYHYEVLATNGSGSAEGVISPGDQTFLTLPNPPAASTGEASGVTTSSASIAGTVTPGSSGNSTQDDTLYYFQYGTTTSYGRQAPLPAGDAGEGTYPVSESTTLEGLQPGVTYHYRIVAANNNAGTPQTVYGEDETLTTAATVPILTSVSASGVTQSDATITGSLDPRALPTRYELQVGSGSGSLAPEGSGNTSSAISLTFSLGSLSPGTLYHYKLTATNANGTAVVEGTFTTSVGAEAANLLTQPPTPPLLSTPSIVFPSETSAGKGNPSAGKSLTRAQKLAKALKACKKKAKSKRAACTRRAHKQFGRSKKKT